MGYHSGTSSRFSKCPYLLCSYLGIVQPIFFFKYQSIFGYLQDGLRATLQSEAKAHMDISPKEPETYAKLFHYQIRNLFILGPYSAQPPLRDFRTSKCLTSLTSRPIVGYTSYNSSCFSYVIQCHYIVAVIKHTATAQIITKCDLIAKKNPCGICRSQF